MAIGPTGCAVERATDGTLGSIACKALVMTKHRVLLVGFAALGLLTVPACGSKASQAKCGPIVHDKLDPGSGTHVLPGSPTPSYIVNPPTSGAHQPGPRITGPVDEPIAPSLQVGVLEEGRILIQYKGVSDEDVKTLEALNSDQVVVAPASMLDGDATVVATAWLTHQSCTGVDTETLKEFVAQRAGKGPAH